MANYKTAIQQTLKWEGGYVNDPTDRGGMTYAGITRVNHPHWSGWSTIDRHQPLAKGEKIPSLEDEVIAFYKANYWDKIRLDEVCNDKVAGFVFDTYTNSGKKGIKVLQEAIGAVPDGIVGDKTIHLLNQTSLEILKKARLQFVKNIVKNDPSQSKFFKGWVNRISSFS